MTDSSNTAGNSERPKAKPRGKPFVSGDKRINRKGRPKSFDALSELAKEIAAERALKPNGEPVLYHGKPMTITEFVLRSWASSTDFRKQNAFMEIAFGKVPLPLQHSGQDGGPIEIMTAVVRIDGEDDAPCDAKDKA
jgi:hypothetical protein